MTFIETMMMMFLTFTGQSVDQDRVVAASHSAVQTHYRSAKRDDEKKEDEDRPKLFEKKSDWTKQISNGF